MKFRKIENRYLRSSFIIEFVVSIVAGLSAFIWSVVFASESAMVDWRFKLRSANIKPTQTDRIVLVEVPENVQIRYQKKDRLHHTPRGYLADLVNKIAEYKPAVIAMDYLFDVPGEKKPDKKLHAAFTNAGNVIIGYHQHLSIKGFSSSPSPTLTSFINAAYGAGFVNIGKDRKGIVRYYDFSKMGEPSFAHQILSCYFRSKIRPDNPPKKASPRAAGYIRRFFNAYGIHDKLYYRPVSLNYRSPLSESFIIYNSDTLLTGPPKFYAPLLKGKIVIIGDGSYKSKDIYRTPFSARDRAPDTHGVLLQALAIRNFLYGDFINDSLFIHDLLIFIVCVLIAFFIAMYFRFLRASLFILIEILVYTLFSYLVFVWWSLQLPLVVIIGGIFGTGLLTILFRIAFSEKDNIDAGTLLENNIPPNVITRFIEKDPESIFKTRQKELVLLVCSPRGIPTLSEQNTPEKISQFLNYYYRSIKEVIFAHDGVFNPIPLNGVLAFWNAPLEIEDGEQKAVHTASEILDRLSLINQTGRKIFADFQGISIDVALHRGPAIAGCLGPNQASGYTATGSAVDETFMVAQNFTGDDESWIVVTKTCKEKMQHVSFYDEVIQVENQQVYRIKDSGAFNSN